MKQSIEVVFDEDVFDGVIYEDGENTVYDKYRDWMESSDASSIVEAIKNALQEWGWEEVIIDGGSLVYPNGIWLGVKAMFPESMQEAVKENIMSQISGVYNECIKSCPVKMTLVIRIEAE